MKKLLVYYTDKLEIFTYYNAKQVFLRIKQNYNIFYFLDFIGHLLISKFEYLFCMTS